jgi:hypothetical protein
MFITTNTNMVTKFPLRLELQYQTLRFGKLVRIDRPWSSAGSPLAHSLARDDLKWLSINTIQDVKEMIENRPGQHCPI